MSDIKGTYPESAQGNFAVVDTIAVPHYYCITPKHLEYSTGVYLDIEGAEAKGAVCDTCKHLVRHGKQDHVLTLKEHETALLVACKLDIAEQTEAGSELSTWLLAIKDEATNNGYVGFAFKDERVAD